MLVHGGTHFTSTAFASQYHYQGALGALYQKEYTDFVIWAPFADSMKLNLYRSGEESCMAAYGLARGTQGTWRVRVHGDLHGVYYTYRVQHGTEVHEVVDPYAYSASANGLRGMVVDQERVRPKGWEELVLPVLEDVEDTILYELHIRDFSMDPQSGMVHRGKYLAFTEENTKGPGFVRTGLEHLKELGITHLHLLPFQDFATVDEKNPVDYNWGYDPLHYNLPEGSYASCPNRGEIRIVECKKMIQALAQAGIRVVMDVVYNHTYYSKTSNFNYLVPGYYYRQNSDGSFSDGSGVGNELATERFMVRKFIVDSLIYWAREYRIAGFRFDLMGLIDIETMTEVRRAMDEVDPSILLYGEGWTGGHSPLPYEKMAVKGNVGSIQGVAVFNDDFRDGVKGHVFHDHQTGFINGGHGAEETVKFGVVAATNHPHVDYGRVFYSKLPWASVPNQCVNYVEAHDNLNLWDKLSASAGWARTEERIQMLKLAYAIVLTSQGIPFLQAGSEFLRTKFGNHNSYNAPDSVNCIRWDQKKQNLEVFQYVKGLIRLRRAHPAFRMRTVQQLQEHLAFLHTSEHMVAFSLYNSPNGDSWDTIVVAYNASAHKRELILPGRNWILVVDATRSGIAPLRLWAEERIVVPSRTCLVLANPRGKS